MASSKSADACAIKLPSKPKILQRDCASSKNRIQRGGGFSPIGNSFSVCDMKGSSECVSQARFVTVRHGDLSTCGGLGRNAVSGSARSIPVGAKKRLGCWSEAFLDF